MLINESARFEAFSPGPRRYKFSSSQNGTMTDLNDYTEPAPRFLAFLTRLPDGRFAPVTGPYYTALAFVAVHRP